MDSLVIASHSNWNRLASLSARRTVKFFGGGSVSYIWATISNDLLERDKPRDPRISGWRMWRRGTGLAQRHSRFYDHWHHWHHPVPPLHFCTMQRQRFDLPGSSFSFCLLSFLHNPLSVFVKESSLAVLSVLLPELVLVKAGRCLGLWLGAEAKYEAGLKDRLAILGFWDLDLVAEL
jgi:hypothetical protein